MQEIIKRRLVGAVILLSLSGILMIWAINNQRGSNNFVWLTPIPPDFNEITIDEQITPPELDDIQERLDDLKNNIKSLNDNDEDAEKSTGKTTEKATGKTTKPKQKDKIGQPSNPLDEITFNANSIPTRWVVQAGSFTTEDSAIKEKKRLAAHNFVSVVRASRSSKNGKIVYAVYIGPFLQQSKAQVNRKLLKEKLKIEGNLRKWE